jgi:hypothetical protein
MNHGYRDRQGRFQLGNPGGPGRSRRAVERNYLETLSETVSLDDWREIVQAAVEDAKHGDPKARDWLCRYLLGQKPLTLTDLAADEVAEAGAERDVLERLAKREQDRSYHELLHESEFKNARKLLKKQASKLTFEGGKETEGEAESD